MVENNACFQKWSRMGILEFSEPVSDMDDMEGDIYDPESVVEVLTLAHVHNVPSEELGFRITADDSRPIFDDDIDVDDSEEPQQAQPVEETQPMFLRLNLWMKIV